MFKKPKRNFRSRRAQGTDSDNEEDGEEKMQIAGETYIVHETAAEDEPVVVKKKKKKKAEDDSEKPMKKSSSVLSFQDEGKL